MPTVRHEPSLVFPHARAAPAAFAAGSWPSSTTASLGSMLLKLSPHFLSTRDHAYLDASIKTGKVPLDDSSDSSNLLTHDQRVSIQAVACALAGLTLCSVFVSLYWFSLMRKKFRHRLIMMLIAADFVRASWLFIFPAISLSRGRISSSSALCQVSGYFTLTGTEMADFSTLAIAVHTAMQILRPTVNLHGAKDTGLSKYQRLIFPAIVLVPLGLAALPFIRSKHGYLSQGSFCTLPLRPFWYRLAISWIPRYAILLAILALYVAIYIYVWRHFKRSPQLHAGSHRQYFETSAATDSQLDGPLDFESKTDGAALSGQAVGPAALQQLDPAAIISWREALETRRESDGVTLVGNISPTHTLDESHPPKALSLKRQSQALGDNHMYDGFSDPILTPGPKNPLNLAASDSNTRDKRALKVQSQQESKERTMSNDLQRNGMQKRYKAIKRQLKLLFIYPICYFFIWLIPLAFNICNYNSYLVEHPVFVVILLSYACNSVMGFVDCMIFSIRERPWRHIPGSDGTFVGSFLFWRHSKNENQRFSLGGSTLRAWSKRASLVDWYANIDSSRKQRSAEPKSIGPSSYSRTQSAALTDSAASAASAVKTPPAVDEESEIGYREQMPGLTTKEVEAPENRREMYWFERVMTNDSEGRRSEG